ncbi:MAG: hypothetical protein IJU19_03845 [Bacteroidales bacterium]|nr:hypothetical protein [Bacteroidales bacterium]
MAHITSGILNAFSGIIGPVLGYEWKGRSCMRSRPAPRNPRTARQQHGRSVFGATAHLWSLMREAAVVGLRGPAAERQVGENNLFVSLNRQCVSVADGEATIDYPGIRIAEGDLAGVAFGIPQVAADGTVEVGFSPLAGAAGMATDYVLLFAFVPSAEEGRLAAPVHRSDGHTSLVLPTRWTGMEVHLYGFAWDSCFRASPSAYIGSLTLQG